MARVVLLAAALAAVAAALTACGQEKITVPKTEPVLHRGAVLFSQRCGGCHTLSAAITHGSASQIRTRERTDGPNFNVRTETMQRVLYAIHNGGFSGAIMPQNIVVGPDANAVARFVSKYAGAKAKAEPTPANGAHQQNVRGTTPGGAQPTGGSTGTKPAK